jgi:multidrug efflux pump subunit AcrA (membrane-fusion protein)
VLVELSYPSVQAAYDRAQQELLAAREALQQARQQYSQQLTAARKRLDAARTIEQRARQAMAPAAAAENAEGAAAIEISPETTPDLQQATEARIAAEQELLQLQSEMEAAVTPHRQRLEAAQQAFQQAQSGRKVAQVRSPIAGTVLTLNARPGQEVGEKEGTPVAVVVDLSALQVHAPVDPSETALRRGVPVKLTFEAIEGREFEGEVDRIVTRPARPLQGEGHLAIISFKNEQGLAKPEMKAHARVIVSEARNVVAVPSDAVDRDEADRPVVQVLRDGAWQSVVVQPGLSDGQYTVIRSGLEEGETIKVTPDLLS